MRAEPAGVEAPLLVNRRRVPLWREIWPVRTPNTITECMATSCLALRTLSLRESVVDDFFSVDGAWLRGFGFRRLLFHEGWLFVALTSHKLFQVPAEFLVRHRCGLGGGFRDRRILLSRAGPGSACDGSEWRAIPYAEASTAPSCSSARAAT